MKYHVVFDFIDDSAPGKVEFGRGTCSKMSSLPIFASPDVAYATILAKSEELEGAIIDSMNNGNTEIAILKKIEMEWNDLMRTQALYVDRIANGDITIIIMAGFRVAKQRGPSKRKELEVVEGEIPCSVFLRRMAGRGAKAYVWQVCIGILTAEGWTTVEITSQATVTLRNLNPDTKYWFRVAIVTANGTSAYCAPVMKFIE